MDCHLFFPCLFSIYFFNGAVPLFLCNCYPRSCNISCLFPSGHSILLFPLELLMTRCRNYIVWAVKHFWLTFLTFWIKLVTTFFGVNVTQVSCKGISLPISEPSVATLPLSFGWLFHKVSVTFCYCFQVKAPLYYFHLSHWWPIIIIVLCGLSHFILIFSMELFHSSCATVTQGPWIFFYCFLVDTPSTVSFWVINDPFL